MPRVAAAPPRRLGGAVGVRAVVVHHRPGAEVAGHAAGAARITCPHAGTETVAGGLARRTPSASLAILSTVPPARRSPPARDAPPQARPPGRSARRTNRQGDVGPGASGDDLGATLHGVRDEALPPVTLVLADQRPSSASILATTELVMPPALRNAPRRSRRAAPSRRSARRPSTPGRNWRMTPEGCPQQRGGDLASSSTTIGSRRRSRGWQATKAARPPGRRRGVRPPSTP